jgi:hypothetical protein
MNQLDVNKPLEENNGKKCYSCGKVFRTPAEFQRHKNRKTPCLIREVPQDQLNNPNRCIFCNKIFTNKSHLTAHLKICKIKNGGMEILVDKVRYEQEIRILKEQRENDKKTMEEKNKEKDEQIKLLIEMQRAQAEKISALEKSIIKPTGNTINNNFNAPINITINNYLKPSLTHLVRDDLFKNTFKQNLVQTPMAIVPLIWFNPEHPENFSIYLVNKSTKETLTYDGANWVVTNADKVTKDVRDRAYEITNGILDNPKLGMLTAYTQNIPGTIKNNYTDEELIKAECETIYNNFMQSRKHRELVKPYVTM